MIFRNHERRPRFRARQPPPFACYCEPVRTLVWQSVLPAGKPGKLAAVWANSLRLTNSPRVLLFFAPCRGVTDCRFAPRHDMQKHAGWLHNTGRCRCTAGKRPCNRSPGASFRAPLAPNAPAPAILAPWPAVEGGPGPAKNSAPWTRRNVY